jgi:flagellar hook-basal body complex protein FliE
MKEITLFQPLESIRDSAITQKQTPPQPSASFEQMLKQSLSDVNQLQNSANKTIEALVTGNQKDIHNTMIAMEKANVAFRLLMQIRNKVISAYETIMRTQI